MSPQKLINYVAMGLFLMNILLMYMIVDIFRAEYNVFEYRLISHLGNFGTVFEQLLKFSKESLISFPTIENSFLNDVFESMRLDGTATAPQSRRAAWYSGGTFQ